MATLLLIHQSSSYLKSIKWKAICFPVYDLIIIKVPSNINLIIAWMANYNISYSDTLTSHMLSTEMSV